MWLLDANMDVHLAQFLREAGISCETAASLGWKDLSNGHLVSMADGAGFWCLLTRDRLFGEAASRTLKLFPHFAVVVVHLPQRRWQEYREQFMKAWAESPIQPVRGRLIFWPAQPV
ncbi:MAG TPA: DUF5615 family PIN-like protein [Terriglobia bacterium]|nr:DUF5615 family PIN-like protein [Terriglobia bacterium]